jgi:hypothetical protein
MPPQFQGMPYFNQNYGFQPPQVAPQDVSSYANGYSNPSTQFMSLGSLPVLDALPIPNSQDNVIRTIPSPVMHNDQLIHTPPMIENNSQTFNMRVQYKGLQLKHPQSLISDLTEIGEKINRVNELSGTDIANSININIYQKYV